MALSGWVNGTYDRRGLLLGLSRPTVGVAYSYDAGGQRTTEAVTTSSGGFSATTYQYHVRGLNGEVLAVYGPGNALVHHNLIDARGGRKWAVGKPGARWWGT